MNPELFKELQDLCTNILKRNVDDPIDLRSLVAQLNSLARRNGTVKASVADMVKDWATAMDGTFFTRDLHTELGFTSREDKKAANMALLRMVHDGLLASCEGKRGCYRPILQTRERLDWQSADTGDVIDLAWPLGLENLFTLYPTNICVLAGEKNAGKTAFLLELASLNARDFPVSYFSTEMMSQELKVRIGLFKNQAPFEHVNFFLANAEFGDLVEPDSINIFDFMELTDEFWKVATKIKRIFDKLRRGIAIIALQKKPGESLGRGGTFSSEKARIYLSMTRKALTLEVVKNWKGKLNPNGKVIPFVLQDSCHFEVKRTSTDDW